MRCRAIRRWLPILLTTVGIAVLLAMVVLAVAGSRSGSVVESGPTTPPTPAPGLSMTRAD